MHLKSIIAPAVTVLCLLWAGGQGARGAVLWNEAEDGDLPGEFSSPQVVVATLGELTVSGTIGRNGNSGATDGSDADYLTIMLPEGLEIVSVSVQGYFSTEGNPGGGSFLGYRAASSFAGKGFSDIDGWVIFSDDFPDLLPALEQPFLGEGDHAFWIQETNPSIVEYSLSFQVVPEPSLGLLAGFAVLLILGRRKRR